MSDVTPGYTFTGITDPITFTKLNLLGQPTVSIGTNEVTLLNMATVGANNILLGRSDTGSGNVEAIDLTTTGLGYYTGAGGAVTQGTSKSTGVTLSKMTGAITLNNAALNSATSVAFTVTNTKVAATDVIIANLASGNTASSYTLNVDAVAVGSFNLSLRNYTGGNLSEAVVINFAVIKGVSS